MRGTSFAAGACLALALSSSAVAADRANHPLEVPKPLVSTVEKPVPGPQKSVPANTDKSAAQRETDETSGDDEESAPSEDTFSTTLAATSDTTSSGISTPDKAYTAKLSPPHNGSFTYAVDVKGPEFRGLEPDFKLNYDSSQGIANNAAHQNWLGLGWSLSGFSVIERASPGRGTPFFNDTLDTYLLDGVEMTLCTSRMTSPGCAAGGTHVTRVENYQRILRDAGANSWTITARDGTQYHYRPVSHWQSYDAASATETKLATQYRWLLASITDTHGNEVSYSYWCDGVLHCYSDEVSYNGSTLKFYREARPVEDQFDYRNDLLQGIVLVRYDDNLHESEETPYQGGDFPLTDEEIYSGSEAVEIRLRQLFGISQN